MPKNIHDLLTSWGTAKRQLPEHNEALKSETLQLLSRLPGLSGSTAKKPLPWLSFAFAGLALVILIVQFEPAPGVSPSQPPPYGKGEVSAPAGRAVGDSTLERIMPPDYYPYPVPTGVPITDTREFLKMSYGAMIRTRHVSDLAQTIRNIIRGSDGRVDSMNTSEKTGYISFAVPANKFDAFQAQIRGLVRARFITENISSENLLPQKQSIETRQEQITAQLSDLRAQRSNLIADHRRMIANLEAQLQQAQTEEERAAIRVRINAENTAYGRKLASYDSQIKNYERQLDDTNKQNQDLIDNVATVTGTITLNWISIWDIINLYAGPYWLPIILAFAALIAYWHHRALDRIAIPAW